MVRRSHRVSGALALAMLLGSCTSGTPADPAPTSTTPSASSPSPATPTEVKVAFIEDLSSDDAVGRVLPAFQAAGLAFANATLGGALPVVVDLVPLDTQGDPSRTADIAQEVSTDPTYVAAVIAPYLSDQATIVAGLDRAAVPMLSLSSRQSGLGTIGLTAWRRVVANRAEEAAAVAAYVGALPYAKAATCIARGPDPDDARWAHLLAGSFDVALAPPVVVGEPDAASAAATSIVESGCRVVVWAGSVTIAESLRTALSGRGADLVFVGGDELKDDTYPDTVGPPGDGTVAFCPCADLSLSTELSAQRFVQDFQVEHGIPPGPYAAEAWDAAKMLVRALGSAATSREDVLAYLDASGPFQGLANRYEFAPDGELASSSATVHAYRDRGGRWIELSLPD